MSVPGRKEKICLRKITELSKGTICKDMGVEEEGFRKNSKQCQDAIL